MAWASDDFRAFLICIAIGNGDLMHSSLIPTCPRCISFCRKAGVVDAEAFLHERLGDFEEAGKLYLAEVVRCVNCTVLYCTVLYCTVLYCTVG